MNIAINVLSQRRKAVETVRDEKCIDIGVKLVSMQLQAPNIQKRRLVTVALSHNKSI